MINQNTKTTKADWFQEQILTLKRYFKTPAQIGMIAPSGKNLCKALTEDLPWDTIKHVAELGPGTGVVTQYILNKANNQTQIHALEMDLNFVVHLKERFVTYKNLHIHNENAILLPGIQEQHSIPSMDAIISGLPFTSLPAESRIQIFESIQKSLSVNGTFVLYQYSRFLESTLKQYFNIKKRKYVLGNIPPAYVYLCQKK